MIRTIGNNDINDLSLVISFVVTFGVTCHNENWRKTWKLATLWGAVLSSSFFPPSLTSLTCPLDCSRKFEAPLVRGNEWLAGRKDRVSGLG